MATTKKLISRILIDLPVDVHRTLKVDATQNETTVKQLIEGLATDKARRIQAKQTELFKTQKK
jgi:hypothetical protein